MSSPKRLLEALSGLNAPGDGGLSREAAQALSEKIVKMSKADAITSRVTCSGSAVESTIIAFSPPVSAISGTIAPLRAAKWRLMVSAVAVEPVMATPANAG